MKRQLLRASIASLLGSTVIASPAFAHHIISGSLQTQIQTTTGLGTTSPTSVATSIVTWILGILAILAVVLIIVAGLQWMTSGGNEEKVTAAKNLLRAALIGLLITLAAYGIALYVVRIFASATGTSLS